MNKHTAFYFTLSLLVLMGLLIEISWLAYLGTFGLIAHTLLNHTRHGSVKTDDTSLHNAVTKDNTQSNQPAETLASSQQELTQTVSEQNKIIDKLLSLAEAEFILVNEGLVQAGEILGSASSKLNTTFSGLHNATQSQSDLLNKLLDDVKNITTSSESNNFDAEQSTQLTHKMLVDMLDIFRSLKDAGSKISLGVDQLQTNSSQSQSIINELSKLIENLVQSKSIDVNNLTKTLKEQCARISQQLQYDSDVLKKLANDTNAISNIQSDEFEAKEKKIEELFDELKNITLDSQQKNKLLNELAEQISSHINAGIISLQFDDMMQQLLGHLRERITKLNTFTIEANTISDSTEQQVRINLLNKVIKEKSEFLEEIKSPVTQRSLDAGQVNLF